MGFYYDLERAITTNGTTQTLSTHLRLLTAAAAAGVSPGWITALFAKARHSVAGGANARLTTCATPGSGATSQTPAALPPATPGASTPPLTPGPEVAPRDTPVVRGSAGF